MSTREESGVSGRIDFHDARYELIPKDDNNVMLVDKIEGKSYIINSTSLEYHFRQSGKRVNEKCEIRSPNQLMLSFSFWESASGHADGSSGSKIVLQSEVTILYQKFKGRFELKSRVMNEEENFEMPVPQFIQLIKIEGNNE